LIVRSLKQAKEKQKTIPVTFLKVFLTGSATAGKTSFSHLLLNKKINENHDSTDLVCASHAVSVQKAAFHGTSVAGADDVTWVELNPSLEIQYLSSFLIPPDTSSDLSLAISDQTNNEESCNINNEHHKSNFMQKSIAFIWNLVGWLTWVIPNFSYSVKEPNSPIEQAALKDNQLRVPTLSQASEAFEETKIASINSENLSSFKYILNDSLISRSGPFIHIPGKKLNIITILDTGGQPQYINLLPTINIHPTVNFVIHDLSKDLKAQVQIEYNKNGKQVVSPYPLSYTYLDMIKLLMSAANDSVDRDTSYAHQLNLHTTKGIDNDSYLCLIGTHKDQVTNEVIKNTAITLTTSVNNMECKASIWQNEDKNVLFAVDNTTAGSEKEDPVASIIRSKIEKVASARDVHELPITWMLLELEIQKFCTQNDKAYISYEECLKIAKAGGLMSSDEEVKSALSYHHLLGVLLYFKDIEGLCDYIITNHQWWLDKLSSIVCLTFQQDLDYRAVNKLKFQGILSKKLLNYVEWKDDIKKEYFLSLLDHMKIIACLDKDKGDYFIPFVLPTYSEQESSGILNQHGSIKGKPLLVQFYSGLLPRGFFCTFVVHLLQLSESWNLHSINDLKEVNHIFNNLITFSLPDAYSLLLFDKINYLELQIRHKEEMFQKSIHYEVYQYHLVPALKSTCEHLKFNFERLRYGFLCSCRIEDHIAFLPNVNPSAKFATCSIDSRNPLKMTPTHMLWFSQGILSDNIGMLCNHIIFFAIQHEILT